MEGPPAAPDAPRRDAALVRRPRVERLIRDGLATGPVVVVAPGGYGKTAAVSAALDGIPEPVVWHACTPRDGDPGRLLVAVLRAVRRTVPGAADVLLEQIAGPGEAVDALELAHALLDDLAGLLVEPLVVVLDDAEQLPADGPVLTVLDALLDADPAVLRLVLVTRRRPALRLARRAAARRVTVVEDSALRFDAADVSAVLAGRDGRAPEADEVAATLARTAGWPLGVALGLGGAAAMERDLDRWIVEEVLDRLTPDDRAALLDGSVEETLDAGPAADPSFLARVAALGLQPRESPGRPGTPAWHPLVREALARRWAVERPEPVRSVLLDAAAGRLLEQGRAADAVERWLAAGQPEQALTAMLVAAPDVLRVAPEAVRRWLDALPPAVAAAPDARWLRGRVAAVQGQVAQAAEHQQAAIAAGLCDDRRDVALVGIMEAAYFLGDLAVADGVRATLEAPAELAGRPLALLASAWLGICLAAHGDVTAGRQLAEEVFAVPGAELAREFEPLLRTFADAPAGRHDVPLGLLARAEAERTLEFPEWMASIRGFLEVDLGRRDEAVEQAARMIARADHAGGTRYWRSLGDVQHAWALAVARRWTEAQAALEPLRDVAFEGWPRTWIDVGLALVADARGEEQAAALAEQALRAGAGAPLFLRTLIVLDVAPVLARAGAVERAAALLDETIARIETALGPVDGAHALARLHARRSALDPEPSATAVRAALAGGADVLRADWDHLRHGVWDQLERGGLEPAGTVALVEGTFRGALPVLDLAAHPTPAVRVAIAPAVAASGHPSAPGRLKALLEDEDPAVRDAARSAATTTTARVPALSVQLFGGFSVQRGPWPIDERAWSRPTAARLVRFLLVQEGEAVPQDLIFEALWPGRAPGSAKTQLQVAVSRARAVLDAPGTDVAASAIQLADGAYRLRLADEDRVDTEAFSRAAASALATAPGPDRRRLLEHAAGLWHGTPLPEERYSAWADPWRERLGGTLHHVLSALVDAQRAEGDEAAVVETAHRLLALDGLDEGAHRALMLAYARTGRPALALRQHLACRRALVDGLGVEPATETVAIQAAVLDGRTP